MSAVHELVSLGFEQQWVETALELTNFNKDIAIEWLLSDEFKKAKEQYDKMKRETESQRVEQEVQPYSPPERAVEMDSGNQSDSHESVEIEYDPHLAAEHGRSFASPRTSLVKLREESAARGAIGVMDKEEEMVDIAALQDEQPPRAEQPMLEPIHVHASPIRKSNLWHCNVCGAENELSHSQCDRCRSPKPSEDAWTCGVCSFMNENEDSICQMCLSVRPSHVDASPRRVVSSTEKTWLCDSCSYMNPEESKLCRLCGFVRGSQVTPQDAPNQNPSDSNSLVAPGPQPAPPSDDEDDEELNNLLAGTIAISKSDEQADQADQGDRESRIQSALADLEEKEDIPKSPKMLTRVSQISTRNVVGAVADAGDGDDDEDLPFKDPSWSAFHADEKDEEEKTSRVGGLGVPSRTVEADSRIYEEAPVSMDEFEALSGRGGDEDDFFFGDDPFPPRVEEQEERRVEEEKAPVVVVEKEAVKKAKKKVMPGSGGQVMVERKKKKEKKKNKKHEEQDEFGLPSVPDHAIRVESSKVSSIAPAQSHTSPAYAVQAKEISESSSSIPSSSPSSSQVEPQKKKEKVKVKLRVGSTVDVYSSSSQQWVEGRIDRIKGDLLCVVYGKNMKWLRKTSRQLRLKPEVVKHAREQSKIIQQQQAPLSTNEVRHHIEEEYRRQDEPQRGVPRSTDASQMEARVVNPYGEIGEESSYPSAPSAPSAPVFEEYQPPPPPMAMQAVEPIPIHAPPPPDDSVFVPPPPGSPPSDYRIVQKKKLTEPLPDEFDYEVTFTEAVLGLELYPDREGKNCIVGRCISATALNHVDPGSLIIQVNGLWVAGGNYDMIRDAVKQAARAPPLTISFRVKVGDVTHPEKSSNKFRPNQRGFLKIKVVAALQLRKRGSYASVTVGAAKLTTQSVSADEHPEWNETLTFKNFRPDSGKRATVAVWQHNRLMRDNVIGDSEFELPTEFDTLKRDTIELHDSKGLAGVIVINSILISRTNTVKHVRRF